MADRLPPRRLSLFAPIDDRNEEKNKRRVPAVLLQSSLLLLFSEFENRRRRRHQQGARRNKEKAKSRGKGWNERCLDLDRKSLSCSSSLDQKRGSRLDRASTLLLPGLVGPSPFPASATSSRDSSRPQVGPGVLRTARKRQEGAQMRRGMEQFVVACSRRRRRRRHRCRRWRRRLRFGSMRERNRERAFRSAISFH